MVTVIPRLYSSLRELKESGFSLEAVPARVEPTEMLMCEPTHFTVLDAKNPFMVNNVGACDTALAQKQWAEVRATYERLGYTVHALPGAAGLEDMVFSANQVLPGIRPDGARYVILSNMVHESRRREVPFYEDWFRSRGYEVLRLSERDDVGPRFEGQGDAIWHPGKYLLWGGYGQRTERAAYEKISALTGASVLLLELVNEKCYHLDTSLCILDNDSALVYPHAFSSDGIGMIRALFKNIVEVADEDADNFAGNAVVLGKHVILQRGSNKTCDRLRAAGFTPIEVDTGEFMKSGGSVFCMKMMVY